MDALPSVGVGLVVSAAVTAGTYAFLDPSLMLLLGIAVVTGAAVAVSAHRPVVLRVKNSKWAGLLGGVNTFAAMTLMYGFRPELRLDAAILGLGLGMFAAVCGAAMALDDMGAGGGEPDRAEAEAAAD
jgi:hypothetical protein